jgi:hypothetical protein
MRKILFLTSFLALFGSFISNVSAQTEGAVKPNLISGEVTTVSAEKIVLKTADGALDALLSDKTVYKRISPENPSMKAAVDSSFSEIGIGDKVVVSGFLATDKKSIPVRTVYLMSKSDIAQKQNKELEQWKRGISGRITAINPQTKEITITNPSLTGAKTTILTPKDPAEYMRFASDSINFSNTKKSSFDELAVEDQIYAAGDKSEDGATFKADKILTGAFSQITGTVTATNVEKGEITIKNSKNNKPVTITIGKTTVLMKQFPADVAQRMAMAQAMAASGGGNMIRPPQGNQTAQQNPQQNPNQMQGGANRGGNFNDLLERFPNINVADLKVGEMIAVLSTKTANQDQINAIKLLSGIEPFIKAQQQMMAAGANRQGGGANSSFTIPGLDGGGLP